MTKSHSELGPAVGELMDRGNDLADSEKHRLAIEVFLEASRLGCRDALFNAGNSYMALGDLKRAARSFKNAATAGVWEAWFNLGDVNQDRGRRRSALRAYLRAAAHGDPKGAVAAAWMLRQLKHPAEAEHLLRVAADAGNDLAAGALGQILFEDLDKHDDRAEVPDAVVALLERGSSQFPEARVDYALALSRQGRIDDAISVLGHGEPDLDVIYMVPLANLLAETGRLAEGRSILERAVQLGDENAADNLRLLGSEESPT